MEGILQSEIFFFISSIGFLIIFSLITIFIIRVLRIMKIAKNMAEKLEGNVEKIGEEAKQFFSELRSSFLYRLVFRKKRK